jgi:hypothetical protein
MGRIDPVKNRKYHREANWKARGMEFPTRPMTGWCELCGRIPPTNRGGHIRLHADHDHETGKFRGWLCRVCNAAIGALGDNESGLLRAVIYVRQHKLNEDLI